MSATRIPTLDVLKGLVMVVMALDHVRDYFHYSVFFFDATDIEVTTPAIFATRWITHFCAPLFSLLAGASAYLAGRRRTRVQLSAFLASRGMWLVFVEVVIVSFGWFFNPRYPVLALQTIWALGMSMIVLAALIHLPIALVLSIGLVLVLGHNTLDGLHYSGPLWGALHDSGGFSFAGHTFYAAYPLLPWIGIMALGYCLGPLYDKDTNPAYRRRLLSRAGWGSLGLFALLTALARYGDPEPWAQYPTMMQTIMDFFDRTKYPPSLQYALMTLGPGLLFLAYGEDIRGRLVGVLATYGRVPFFYYILHIYLIHGLALVAAQLTGFGWHSMILTSWDFSSLRGFGFPLWVVYLIWLGVVAALYPLCAWFDRYKQVHKDRVWLSYL